MYGAEFSVIARPILAEIGEGWALSLQVSAAMNLGHPRLAVDDLEEGFLALWHC